MNLESVTRTVPPGTLIGDRFRIERTAGVGGMGAVFRARDELTDSDVALKILIDHSEAAVDRFLREAKLLEQLDHPAIVKYVAHGQTLDGEAWLAMEWLEGEDLSSRLEREGLRVSESLGLASRLADALGVAHARGVVHRDIKPSNVFLPGGRWEDAKILDFGIARPLGAKTALTRTGTIMGTPGYMAPEQLEGNAVIDTRADVFSLGALLFECLTGKPAFAGEHVMAVLARLLLEEAPRVDELRNDVPSSIVDLVALMLSKDRDKRPRDGRSVATALSAMGRSTGAPPPARTMAPALTGSEQRMLCVVVALMDTSDRRDVEFGATIQSSVSPPVIAALRHAVKLVDARVDEVAGALLVSLAGSYNPSDHAARAARCALVMRAHLPGVPMVIVTGRGEAGGRLPVGPVVDRAATLLAGAQRADADRESEARAAIWVDDVTRALLDVRFDVMESGGSAELLGEREVGESSRSLLGKATPCVGRERELSALEGIVDASLSDDRAHAVVVAGPAGIGKSRVRYELVRRLRQRFTELTIWVGRADQTRAGSAYFLLGSILRHAAGIGGNESAEERRAKLAQLASVVRPSEQARVAAFLGEIAGEPFAGDAVWLRAARADAVVMNNELRRAFDDFMEASTVNRPVCLVLEDLHWADQPSVRLIDRVLGALSDRPLCVISLARPEVHDVFPRLFAERAVDEIRLGELGRKAAERLVKHALGEQVDSAMLAKIVDRAAGNAFVLEEMIRAVAERRSDTLPETVLGMVEARLASLSFEQRRALRAASIFGETFWASGIASLAFAEQSGEASNALAELVEREVIKQHGTSRFAGELEYSFRHALIREGAHAMLTESDRLLGHKLAAEWLEKFGETDPVVLAEHWEHAADGARSAWYYSQAAQQALHLGDLELAKSRVQRGLAGQPDSNVRAELHLVNAEALAFMSDMVGSSVEAERALEIATPGSRTHTLALAGLVSNAQNQGNMSKMVDAIPLLLNAEPTPDARSAFAWPLSLVVDGLIFAGQRELAEQFLAKLARLAESSSEGDSAAAWSSESHGLYALLMDDQPFVALQQLSKAAELFERAGHWHHAAYARSRLGWVLMSLGDFEGAEAQFTMNKAPSASAQLMSMMTAVMRVFIRTAGGDAEGAIADVHAVFEAAKQNHALLSAMHLQLTRANLALLRLDEAREQCRLFRETSLGLPGDVVVAAALEAMIWAEKGEPLQALELAEQALAGRGTALPHGSHVEMAFAAQTRAYQALGRMDEARASARQAHAWLMARADRIPDPKLRKSFLERLPDNAALMRLVSVLGE